MGAREGNIVYKNFNFLGGAELRADLNHAGWEGID